MAHFSVSVDKPGFDSVVVIETIWSCMESSHRDQLFSGWLHVTSLICAARLQRYLAPVPPPRHRKSCRRLRKRRLIELRTCPSFSIVRRNFDTGNATAAGPCEAAGFVPTAALQNVFPGWTRNDRLRFHNKCECARFSIRHEVSVNSRFLARHERLICHHVSTEPFDVDVAFPAE